MILFFLQPLFSPQYLNIQTSIKTENDLDTMHQIGDSSNQALHFKLLIVTYFMTLKQIDFLSILFDDIQRFVLK
jgi:hypothetical protein